MNLKNIVMNKAVRKILFVIGIIVCIALVESGTGKLALAAVLAFVLGRYCYALYKYWDVIKGFFYMTLAQEQSKQYAKRLRKEEGKR